MQIKILFCFCLVLLFTGCHEMYTVHYVYRNGTDKSLEVVAYDITDNAQGSAVEIQYRFSLVPDGEYSITVHVPGNSNFFPFWTVDYVQLSNDEQAVVFAKAGDIDGVKYSIFRPDCYKERSRKRTLWRTYIFTEADFRDGVPVTEESDTDY